MTPSLQIPPELSLVGVCQIPRQVGPSVEKCKTTLVSWHWRTGEKGSLCSTRAWSYLARNLLALLVFQWNCSSVLRQRNSQRTKMNMPWSMETWSYWGVAPGRGCQLSPSMYVTYPWSWRTEAGIWCTPESMQTNMIWVRFLCGKKNLPIHIRVETITLQILQGSSGLDKDRTVCPKMVECGMQMRAVPIGWCSLWAGPA